MERLGGERAGSRGTSMRTVALASFMGATFEWYDFFLYGTAAAVVFGPLFFPNADPLLGTLASFATFGVGFVTRPVGGLIFGHYGDRIGRKSMLVLTLLIMGIATFLIGLVPTYDSIGIWAPVLLVTLRLLQGLGLGGEYGGAALMTVEHAPRERRGFYGSLPQVGVPAGLLLATGLFALVSLLPEEQFLSWGWRVPFLLSIVLLGVGLFVRARILETPAFAEVKETGTEAQMPLVELVRTYPKNILLALGARFADTAASNIFNAFAISYVSTQLGLSSTLALTGVVIAAALEIFLLPIFGALSDRIGRRPLYMAGAAFVALFAFPFFWLLNTESTVLIWFAIVLGFAVGTGLMFSVQATLFTELFGTRVRYSGISVAYQISALLGGFVPLIATALLAGSGGDPWLVAAFLVAVSLVSLVSTYLITETYRSDVSETELARERPGTREGVGGGVPGERDRA